MISTDVLFGTLNSRTDLNLIFTHADMGAPEVHTEYVEVPGRDPVDLSELVSGKPQYNNREMTIEFEFVGPGWEAEKELVLSKLHGKKMQIRFSQDPNWYYIGRIFVESEVNASTLHFTMTVTAEPWKYQYNEQVTKITTAGGTVTNPTEFDSQPLLHILGTAGGTVTVGNNLITIGAIDTYIDIDCKLMDCYQGTVNCNQDVTMAKFPTLPPGATGISWTGGVTAVWVTGRWRTL